MTPDTRTAICIVATIGAVAFIPAAIYGGIRLYDAWMESRTPEGMVYTAGNGPTGAQYEPDHSKQRRNSK